MESMCMYDHMYVYTACVLIARMCKIVCVVECFLLPRLEASCFEAAHQPTELARSTGVETIIAEKNELHPGSGLDGQVEQLLQGGVC